MNFILVRDTMTGSENYFKVDTMSREPTHLWVIKERRAALDFLNNSRGYNPAPRYLKYAECPSSRRIAILNFLTTSNCRSTDHRRALDHIDG